MITIRTVIAAVALAVTTTGVATGQAGAEPGAWSWTWAWTWERSNQDAIGAAAYDRDSRALWIDDQELDGLSVYVEFSSFWYDYRCWYTGGWDGERSSCDISHVIDRLGGAGAEVGVSLCTGRWRGHDVISPPVVCSDDLGSAIL